jgi:hypothetical protein
MSGYERGQLYFIGAAGVFVLVGGAITGHVGAMLLGLGGAAVCGAYILFRSRRG